MDLPPTHYDVALKNVPDMIKYLRRDLTTIAEKRLRGPFEGDGEFAHPVDNYVSYLSCETIKHAQEIAEREHGISRDDPAWNEQLLFLQDPFFVQALQVKFSEYMTVLNFELFEKKTFFVSNHLAEHLALTELNIDADVIRLPFESCLFVYTSPVVIEALYQISERTLPCPDAPVSVFLTGLPAGGGKRMIRMVAFQSDYGNIHIKVKRDLLVKEGWLIEDLLTTDWEKLREDDPDLNAEFDPLFDRFHSLGGKFDQDGFGKDKVSDNLFYTKGLPFFRIVVNTVLYLASNTPEVTEFLSPHNAIQNRLQKVKSQKKRRNIKKNMKRTSCLDFCALGASMGKIVVQKPVAASETAEDETDSRRYASRFLVRGHWRNQAHGEKLSKRKLIWILPYWKGPDMGQLITRPYVVT